MQNIKYGFYKNLLDAIEGIGPLPVHVKDLIVEKFKRKTVKKNDILQNKNTFVKHIYFIQTGFVRGYYTFDDIEVTTWLNGPGNFIVSISSFFGKIPAKETVQAITDGQLIYMDVNEFFEIIHSDFQSFKVYQQMLEYYYYAAEERVFISKIPTSKERYEYFINSRFYPHLVGVPNKYLADLLGIRPETLSRLKNG